jgi:hypothetical protein
MDSRIMDEKVKVRNVVAAQSSWLLARFLAAWGEGNINSTTNRSSPGTSP